MEISHLLTYSPGHELATIGFVVAVKAHLWLRRYHRVLVIYCKVRNFNAMIPEARKFSQRRHQRHQTPIIKRYEVARAIATAIAAVHNVPQGGQLRSNSMVSMDTHLGL
jgi:hypothetical protein